MTHEELLGHIAHSKSHNDNASQTEDQTWAFRANTLIHAGTPVEVLLINCFRTTP
jgi:hypothetical protein